jgi:hypothetical protein
MSAEPYASARRVFWVVDNGASHRNLAAAARLSGAYPNALMVHLPVHASWLNQVYFSVIQHKLLTLDDFEDQDQLAAQILTFEKRYNATARPFHRRFTRHDLKPAPSTHQAPRSALTTPTGRMTPDGLTVATTRGCQGALPPS